MNSILKLSLPMLLMLGLSCCRSGNNQNLNENTSKDTTQQSITAPEFSADSAYACIEKQVSFGPRVPNTAAHEKAATYLIDKIKQYTKNVEIQRGTVTTYDGKILNITNILANFYPESSRKILLVSHYDCRPFADQDSVDKDKPIIAANDGASGVGVLMEMARQLSTKNPGVGVTIFFTDAEDYGVPDYDTVHQDNNSYCLGTQFWAKSLQRNQYVADYGVVLDMVGAKTARFLQEANSLKASSDFVYRVWSTAYALGHYDHFIMSQTRYGIIDDHVYVTQMAGVPCIDIVDYDANRPKGFDYYWHTHQDNMSIIDKNTLQGVGETLLAVLFDMGKKNP